MDLRFIYILLLNLSFVSLMSDDVYLLKVICFYLQVFEYRNMIHVVDII